MDSSPENQPQAKPQPQAQPRAAARPETSRAPDGPGSGLADPHTPLPSSPAPRGLAALWAFIAGLFGRGCGS